MKSLCWIPFRNAISGDSNFWINRTKETPKHAGERRTLIGEALGEAAQVLGMSHLQLVIKGCVRHGMNISERLEQGEEDYSYQDQGTRDQWNADSESYIVEVLATLIVELAAKCSREGVMI
ncbi:hypothetical protein HJFPF1_02391 [Paramyrothecium foliicola]|nr:hypothetical protein HJFPF1_02391 [Paramyrothecium foliicola]